MTEQMGVVRGRRTDVPLCVHQAAIERYLERAIGRMIDINYHFITESGHPPRPDYHASFIGN